MRYNERMKNAIKTENAAPAIGAYSQATQFGNLVYTSGQLGLQPNGEMIEGGAAEQARQALDNVRAVLQAAGTDLDRVVKTTIFVANMDDFAAINAVYAEYFEAPYPARSLVQVARLPKDGLVEIEVLAEMH